VTTFLLLPPSEGKRPGGNAPWEPGDDALGLARRAVAKELRSFVRRSTAADRSKLFGVRGDHLDRAVASAASGCVGQPALPASQRYSGVVWEHLDLASLPTKGRRHAARHVVVVSALAGFVAGGEPVPDYRLKLSARLGRLGNLATWWRPTLAAIGKERFGRHTVIDLLPNEHRGAFEPAGIARRTVAVQFVTHSGAHAAGHAAKAAKGLLARSLIAAAGVDPVEVCAEFDGAGFAFSDVTPTDVGVTVRIRAA
jgi:uncharacterized protein